MVWVGGCAELAFSAHVLGLAAAAAYRGGKGKNGQLWYLNALYNAHLALSELVLN